MTDPYGPDPSGTTPLTDDDLQGLKLRFVTTRADLNDAEATNIEQAREWAFVRRRARSVTQLFDVAFIDDIHRRMFGQVWKWAGAHRQRDTNIGVDPYLIAVKLRDAVDDAHVWHERSVFEPVELAVRFHHRLVVVHPYPNGNGRHARFVADLYLAWGHGLRGLSWGGERLEPDGRGRAAYLEALRAADRGDFTDLIAFATR